MAAGRTASLFPGAGGTGGVAFGGDAVEAAGTGKAVTGGGGVVTSGTGSAEAGQLEMGSTAGIVEGSGKVLLMVEDGGHAGIECSVGGSGGQMSVSSGIAPCAGATSSSAAELCITTASSSEPPAGAGTVCAHSGVGFAIGTACFGSVLAVESAGVSVVAHSGSDSFCIGSAGRGSASSAVSKASSVPLSLTGGTTGTVRAHTGVVSRVGTAGAGSSGGVESFELPG